MEQGVGISMGLFQNRVIDDQNGEIIRFQRPLGPPNQEFGVAPDLARIQVYLTQLARHLVVTNLPVKETRKACGRGLARRTEQIIRVQIQRANH